MATLSPVKSYADELSPPSLMASLVVQALVEEVQLTPKPGLVDGQNNGAHRDMDLPLFLRSIQALTPWFSRFESLGMRDCDVPASDMLPRIRPTGMACEQAMYAATAGVNTHKGGIFSLGLLCCALGRLRGRGAAVGRRALCDEVAAMCARLVERELQDCREPSTVGERLFVRYGLTGARGEAASGFRTVYDYALPAWEQLTAAGVAPRRRLLHCLLVLMAHNPDTNVVSRGGIAGLQFVQTQARQLLAGEWRDADLVQLDNACIARNLSPGGSADLLAITCVLANFPA
ncbi:triphosphoribosyl-dephospho-CoA synthase CitG [Rahnella sp. SAP-1]|uniref:Probable 2-(5''-triphosphoribosyl)-3'-dephosphocoenzyme-A synthase n=1 Tax=Rouxiella aceris TaxID=2703884 RepID=A0A848MP47_9GAMM|nr:triphosphoribosyl-dephospho-CoA synthase CitG [Rouxiella aceris]